MTWLYVIGFPLAFVLIGFVAWIAGIVISYILLYRYWLLIQDGKARTSPGKAVGFCFIPFFNYYWFYVAHVGLAKEMNAYCREHHIPGTRVSEGLALLYFIGSVSTMIVLFPLPIHIPIQIFLMKQFTDVGVRILEYKADTQSTAALPPTAGDLVTCDGQTRKGNTAMENNEHVPVVITRTPHFNGKFVRWHIDVDGRKVGMIGNGKTETIDLPVGRHEIHVGSSGFTSRPVVLDLQPGQPVFMECGNLITGWKILLSGFYLFQPHAWFYLRTVQEPVASLTSRTDVSD